MPQQDVGGSIGTRITILFRKQCGGTLCELLQSLYVTNDDGAAVYCRRLFGTQLKFQHCFVFSLSRLIDVPESFNEVSGKYVAKKSSINHDIDAMRHRATRALLTRNDVVIVASVSCSKILVACCIMLYVLQNKRTLKFNPFISSRLNNEFINA